MEPLNPDPLPITVPFALHDGMIEAFDKIEAEAEDGFAAVNGRDFAVSYLCGALVVGSTLRTRTRIALERLSASPVAVAVIAGQNLTLGKPLSRHEREPIPAVTRSLERYRRTGNF